MGQRAIHIAPELLARFLRGDACPCNSMTPDDVTVVRAFGPEAAEPHVTLVCESSEWAAVPQGESLPVFVPRFNVCVE